MIQFAFGCVILSIGCTNYMNMHMSYGTSMKLDIASKCAICFCVIAWILAFQFRYKFTGLVCSGDFLEDMESTKGYTIDSGLVVSIFLWTAILSAVIGICFVCFLFLACIGFLDNPSAGIISAIFRRR